MAKELKLKVRKFLGLIPKFAEITGEKLLGDLFAPSSRIGLTPKQMLQRLPIAIAQVKAGNNSECLLNEIKHIVYSLYQSKEITQKVYNNITKSI